VRRCAVCIGCGSGTWGGSPMQVEEPSSRSSRNARRTVFTFTLSTAAKSFAGGSRSPGFASPSAIARRISAEVSTPPQRGGRAARGRARSRARKSARRAGNVPDDSGPSAVSSPITHNGAIAIPAGAKGPTAGRVRLVRSRLVSRRTHDRLRFLRQYRPRERRRNARAALVHSSRSSVVACLVSRPRSIAFSDDVDGVRSAYPCRPRRTPPTGAHASRDGAGMVARKADRLPHGLRC